MLVLQSILDLLKVVFGWRRAEARRCAIDLEHSPILKLPPELILCIADYLPIESRASLSLTCHTLYSSHGKQCLEPLAKAEYSVMNRFLHFLERDLPTYIVCPHCNRLHSMSDAEKYHLSSEMYTRASKPWLPCSRVDYRDLVELRIGNGFSSTIFRMVMKAHRQGHETTKFLDLLSHNTKNLDGYGFREQRTAAYRIQEGSLLGREQRIFMVPSSQKVPLPWCGFISICFHIKFSTMTSLYEHGIQIPYADEIDRYENRQGLIYCEHCCTEFRVDFKSYGEAKNAMFVTKWMDIGEGRDLSDHEFKNQLGVFKQPTWAKLALPRGSIFAAFEQIAESDFKFDSLLTQQNEKDLCMSSPLPWPEGKKVSFVGLRQTYMVRGGRILSRSIAPNSLSISPEYVTGILFW